MPGSYTWNLAESKQSMKQNATSGSVQVVPIEPSIENKYSKVESKVVEMTGRKKSTPEDYSADLLSLLSKEDSDMNNTHELFAKTSSKINQLHSIQSKA